MHSSKILLATALTVAFMAVAPPAQAYYESTYFPLAAGNEWVYTQSGFGAGSSKITVTCDAMQPDSTTGALWFKLTSYLGPTHWVRQTTTGRIYESRTRVWYQLGAAAGATWTMSSTDPTGCNNGATLAIISRDERVTVPGGTFSTIHIRFRGRCADAGVTDEWFARGIGLVKRAKSTIGGPRYAELERATVAGRVVAGGGGSTGPGPVAGRGEFGISGTVPASRVRLRPVVTTGLAKPTAMAFHPQDGSLWIVSMGDDTSVVVDAPGTAQQRATKYRDTSNHFMNNPTAIAFSRSRNELATTQDTTNDYNGHAAHGNNFMGPTLWPGGRPAYTGDASCHLDMLHHSPQAMGVAAGARTSGVDRREYWVFNGQSGAIDRYFFHEPHAPGADDHADGITVRYAAGQVRRIAGVPSHLALDVAGGQLYIADTGNARIARLDTRGSMASARPIAAHHNETPLYGLTTSVQGVSRTGSGLVRPSGLILKNSSIVVADHGTGHIRVFGTDGSLNGVADTGLGAGALMGIAETPSGKLYLLDSRGGKVLQMEIVP